MISKVSINKTIGRVMYRNIMVALMVFSTIIPINAKFAYVTSENGLRVRDGESASSKVLYVLPHKTNIKVLKTGREDLINGKKNNWYYISFYNDEGWVFGEYINQSVPKKFTHEYVYKSESSNRANLFFIFFKDNTFSLYFDMFNEETKSERIIFSGKWHTKDSFICFSFDKNQPCSPKCDPLQLFVHEKGYIWEKSIIKFKSDLKVITIWNIVCPNVKHWPVFQYK